MLRVIPGRRAHSARCGRDSLRHFLAECSRGLLPRMRPLPDDAHNNFVKTGDTGGKRSICLVLLYFAITVGGTYD